MASRIITLTQSTDIHVILTILDSNTHCQLQTLAHVRALDVSDPLIVIIHAPSFFCDASLNEFTIACGRHHDQQSRISCTSGQDLVRMQAWANASMSLCEVARTNPVDPQQRTQDSQTISASLPMPCLTPS